MAFTIKNILSTEIPIQKIYNDLIHILTLSRFTARIESNHNKITIHNVRLKQSKHYCGNHPFACPVRPFEKPHKKLIYLEGADWVAFNDMINDVLDRLFISADVRSSLVIIRKDKRRCVYYWGHLLNAFNNEWNKEGEFYEDWMGRKAPRSRFPKGTPGIPEYLMGAVEQ